MIEKIYDRTVPYERADVDEIAELNEKNMIKVEGRRLYPVIDGITIRRDEIKRYVAESVQRRFSASFASKFVKYFS